MSYMRIILNLPGNLMGEYGHDNRLTMFGYGSDLAPVEYRVGLISCQAYRQGLYSAEKQLDLIL